MPIIDAHLHLFAPSPQTTAMASAVGHGGDSRVSAVLLRRPRHRHGHRHVQPHAKPGRPCLSILFSLLYRPGRSILSRCDATAMRRLTEENLRRENCVGIKLLSRLQCGLHHGPLL